MSTTPARRSPLVAVPAFRRRWWRSLAAVLVLLAVVAGSTGGATANPPPSERPVSDLNRPAASTDAPLSFNDQVDQDVAIRRLAGFEADRGYVQALVLRATAGDPSLERVMTAAFTQAEAAEMRARLAMQGHVGEIARYGEAHPDDWAGMYIDRGAAVAVFTGRLAEHQSALNGRFAAPGRLRVQQGRWSWSQLVAASTQLGAMRDQLAAQGMTLYSVTPDPRLNVVRVGLAEVTPAATAYFAERFAPGLVQVERGEPAYPAAAIVGGSPISGPYGSCTAGFSYRNWDGSYGFFSAGHSGSAGQVWTSGWYPNQSYTVWGSVFGNSGTDSMVLPAPYADTTNQAGWIVVTGAAGAYDDPVGSWVCQFGAATGTQRCGTITSIDAPYWVRWVDTGVCPGATRRDSGGPVYSSDSRAYGILSLVSVNCEWPAPPPDQQTIFSKFGYTAVRYAMDTWGVTVPR